MNRIVPALAGLVLLAGCAQPTWAPEDAVQRALYRPEGPAKIALYTVQSTKTARSGAHSAILVTGSHRALFDPAGTFYHPGAPERNDVHFGITDTILKVYVDYHARETFDVIVQEVEVSPEVAELALREIQNYGAVGNARCTLSVSTILSRLPGFDAMRPVWFPMKASEDFATLPGATFRRITDDDADDNHGVLFRARFAYEDEIAASE